MAVERGNIAMVELLLKHGADVNRLNEDHGNRSALFTAVKQNRPVLVAMLIEAKADVNARQKDDRRSPLCNASRWGLVDIAQLLIAAGADVNQESSFVNNACEGTPLLMASYRGELEIAQMLIENGADLEGW